jgi:hypothetical protein
MMIRLICSGCGCEGRVRDCYAGQRVRCKRCRAENTAPESVMCDGDWIAEFNPPGGSASRADELHALAMAMSSWAD